MKRVAAKIRFRAKLLRPASPKNATWSFLILPKGASSKLPTRAMTTVEGTIGDSPFRATLEPDGQRSHWLKVPRKMRLAAGAKIGEEVELEITPAAKQLEPSLPADLRKALAAAPTAQAAWLDITTIARRDWIQWISSAKKSETRARRVGRACEMLAAGEGRVCCFDRSGIYSKGLSAPEAAE
jgi:hypothetical protein